MQINLSAKHMTLTPAIEEYARKKIEKFSRYFDRIQAVEVMIAKDRNGFSVEIRTDVEHHDDFIATSTHDDLYACIDITSDRSIRQLTDHKSRIRNHHHAGHQSGPGGVHQATPPSSNGSARRSGGPNSDRTPT